MDDPATYLARRAREQYSLSSPATAAELWQACEARGYPVTAWDGPVRGYCVTVPRVQILVIPGDAEAIGHELFHAWVAENAGWGIEYPPHLDPEAAAERFARLVTG